MREPLQQRGADKVSAILRAARELLQTEDEAAVTTSSVAHRAGVSVASVYRYFRDIDDILDVLIGEHASAAGAAVDAALDGPARSVAEVFARVLDAHLVLYDERPELTRVWFSPRLAARQRELDLRADRALAERVGHHLVDSGLLDELSDADEHLLAAQWETAGTLLGLSLTAPAGERDRLTDELRALVAHFAARVEGVHEHG